MVALVGSTSVAEVRAALLPLSSSALLYLGGGWSAVLLHWGTAAKIRRRGDRSTLLGACPHRLLREIFGSTYVSHFSFLFFYVPFS